MQQEGKLKCFLVMCHRTSILSQWRTSAERLGLLLEPWSESSHSLQNADGWLVTYQGAASQLEGLKQALEPWAGDQLLAIADEAHHLGVDPDEPDGPVWGRTFLELSSQARLRLGLTGTPFRADNLAFCAARRVRIQEGGQLVEQISPDLCVDPREQIAAGDVRPLEFRFQDGWV